MDNNEINNISDESGFKLLRAIVVIAAVIVFIVAVALLIHNHSVISGKNSSIFATDEISFNYGEFIKKPNMKFDNDKGCEYCYGSSPDEPTCLINITDEHQTITCAVCEKHSEKCFYCDNPAEYITSNNLLMPFFLCEDCVNSIIERQNNRRYI